MSSIYCSHGHENASDNRFCRLCGEPLSQPISQPMPGTPHPLFLSQQGRPLDYEPHVGADPNIGKIVGQRYQIQQQLGHGGFGRTYLAFDINRFNEPCVLKEFAPQVSDPDTLKKAEQLFEREAGVLYQLHHPQIPCFRELLRVEVRRDVLSQSAQTRLFLVQDYVKGQNYHDLL
ncbi:MAG: hypothetical protein F6K09_19210, partial [Merismopedia sp. SIO2A8]|nr:hypothetical protein [Merismopedia sp. SIO2A8]